MQEIGSWRGAILKAKDHEWAKKMEAKGNTENNSAVTATGAKNGATCSEIARINFYP